MTESTTPAPAVAPALAPTTSPWLLAIRPKTLPAAASSAIVGIALAWHDGRFAWGPALAALVVALLLQIGSNLANDVYDDERGADTAERLGPTRVTQSGLLSRKQVKTGMAAVLAVAFLVGVYLTWVRGWWVLVIGIAAIVSAVAYTGGPYPLGYHGLGEVFVFAFFGPAEVVGTYWVQTGRTTPAVWLMSIPLGLIITGILVVNNLRDIEQDVVAGKRTIAVRLGARATKAEYLGCIALAYLAIPVGAATGVLPWWAMLTWLSFPQAALVMRQVLTVTGRPLNRALAGTGRVALSFALLFAVALLFA